MQRSIDARDSVSSGKFLNSESYLIDFLACLSRADWTFLEAPESEEEMIRYCAEVDGPKLANMLEFGKTPILSPKRYCRHTQSPVTNVNATDGLDWKRLATRLRHIH
jgi:hypothetical protein